MIHPSQPFATSRLSAPKNPLVAPAFSTLAADVSSDAAEESAEDDAAEAASEAAAEDASEAAAEDVTEADPEVAAESDAGALLFPHPANEVSITAANPTHKILLSFIV